MLHKCLLSTWIIICKCGLTVYSLSLPEGGAVHPVFVSFPSVLSFRGQLMTGQKTDYIDFFQLFPYSQAARSADKQYFPPPYLLAPNKTVASVEKSVL